MNPKFKRKHDEWKAILRGPDENSIYQQVLNMTWTMARFRLVNEARRFTESDQYKNVKSNWLLHGLLNECFFQSQAVAIRRVTSQDKITGKWAACSLVALFTDVIAHVDLLTRENLLALRGYPMDLSDVIRREREYIREHARKGGCCIPEELDAGRMDEWHKAIDMLCKVDAASRSLNDRADRAILNNAKKSLMGLDDIHIWVNKFVAHAATAPSRSIRNADKVQVNLKKLWDAHEKICRAMSFLDLHIISGVSHHLVPMIPDGPCLYLDEPLIGASAIPHLEEKWKSFAAKSEEWGHTNARWFYTSRK